MLRAPVRIERELLWLLVIGASAFGVLIGYFELLGALGLPGGDSYLRPYLDAGWPTWTAYAQISLYPAIVEELAFRGFIQTRLERVLSRNDALILQAAMSSILHLSPIILVSHFLMGLAFGLLRITTGRLYAGMLLHAAWNAYCLMTDPLAG